jgi:hypothetical protein
MAELGILRNRLAQAQLRRSRSTSGRSSSNKLGRRQIHSRTKRQTSIRLKCGLSKVGRKCR